MMNESVNNTQIAWFYGWKSQISTPHQPSLNHPIWMSSKPVEALIYSYGKDYENPDEQRPGTPYLAIVELSDKLKAIDFSLLSKEQLNEILIDPPYDILEEFSCMDWNTEDAEDHRDFLKRASLYVILQKFNIPYIAKMIAVDGLDPDDDDQEDQILDTLTVIHNNSSSETNYPPDEDVIYWLYGIIEPDELKAAWSKCPGSTNTKLEYEVSDDSIFLNCLLKQIFFQQFVDAGYNAVAENEFNAKSLAILSPEAIKGVAKKVLQGKDEIQDFINRIGGENQINIPLSKALDCLNN